MPPPPSAPAVPIAPPVPAPVAPPPPAPAAMVPPKAPVPPPPPAAAPSVPDVPPPAPKKLVVTKTRTPAPSPPAPEPEPPPAAPRPPQPRLAPRLSGPAPAPAFTAPPMFVPASTSDAAPPKPPREPMGLGAKIALLSFVVVAALAAGGFYLYQQRSHTPTAGAIKSGVEKVVTNPLLKVTEVAPTLTPAGDAFDVQYRAVAELREPLYVELENRAMLRDDLKVDVEAWQTARQTISGKDGARILELAGLKVVDDTLLKTTFLKEVSPKGAKVTFEGKLRATKSGSDWRLVPQGDPVSIALPPGDPRAKFGGRTTLVGNAAEMTRLREMAKAQSGLPAKIEQGRIAMVAERRANQEKTLANLLADLATGTLFAGTASAGTGSPEKLYLEITALQEGEKQVSALLRNEGGWGDARPFQGGFVFNPDEGTMTVTLATQRNQAVKKAGPFLDRNESWQMVLTFSDGRLTGHSGDSEYSFTRLSALDATAARSQLDAVAAPLRAATAPGKVFRGTISAKSGAESHEFLVRFNRQDNDGAVLGLTLEPAGHGGWQRIFRGSIIASRSRAEGWPLRLESASRDALKSAPGFPLLTAREDFSVSLKLADGRLVGSSRDYNWDFAGVSEEEIAKFDAEQAELKKQFLALVKVGASYTGRAQAADSDQPERVRLRFTLVDQRGGVIEALLESLEVSGVNREFRGTFDLVEGRLVLTSSGRTHGRPGKAIRLPVFVDSSAEAALVLKADGEKLSAEAKPSGWKLEF